MRKIKTIFYRDWDSKQKLVISILDVKNFDFSQAIATEKVDGINVRATIRNNSVVRMEKRRNPTVEQKEQGIVDPWYVDCNQDDPADKHIYNALQHTNINLPDGEWSAEAIGPNFQGNPLELSNNQLFFFSIPEERAKVILHDAPVMNMGLESNLRQVNFWDDLKNYLENKKSSLNPGCNIEGIVWHGKNGDMVKIKRKDFSYKKMKLSDEVKDDIQALKDAGFKPIAISKFICENTFIFETEEEAKKAHDEFEKRKIHPRVIQGWWYGREELKESLRNYKEKMGYTNDVYWLTLNKESEVKHG
mgnify:CR=1 FL=1